MTHYEFRKAIALALLDPKNYWPNRMRQSSKLASSVASEAHVRQQQQYPAIISEQERKTVQLLQNQLIATGSDHM